MSESNASSHDQEIRKAALKMETLDTEVNMKDRLHAQNELSNSKPKPHLKNYLVPQTDARFSSDVEKIRKLSKTDKAAAREKIAQVRAESTQLQERGIQLQDLFFTALDENPDISKQDLISKFDSFNLDKLERESILGVKKELEIRRKKTQRLELVLTNRAKQILGQTATTQEIEQKMGELLFTAASGQQPSDTVELLRSPFALGFVVNSDGNDKQTITNTPASGHYSDQGINVHFFSKTNWKTLGLAGLGLKSTPYFFVTDKGKFGKTVDHEIGHGINKAIVEGLPDKAFKEYWKGKTNNQAYPAANRVNTARKQLEKKEISAEEAEAHIRKSMGEMLSAVLNKAKNELVTDFLATSNFDYVDSIKLKPIEKNSKVSPNLYNYFKDFGVRFLDETDSSQTIDIYNKITKEYNEILEQQTQKLKEYCLLLSRFSLSTESAKKAKIAGFIRQNPVSTWSNRFDDIFGAEFKQLQEADNVAKNLDITMNSLSDQAKSYTTNGINLGKATNNIKWLQNRGQQTQDLSSLINQADALVIEIETVNQKLRPKYTISFDYIKQFMTDDGEKKAVLEKLAKLEEKCNQLDTNFEQIDAAIQTDIQNVAKQHSVTLLIAEESSLFDLRRNQNRENYAQYKQEIYQLLTNPTISFDYFEHHTIAPKTYTAWSFLNNLSHGEIDTQEVTPFRNKYPTESNYLEQTILPLFSESSLKEQQISQLQQANRNLFFVMNTKVSEGIKKIYPHGANKDKVEKETWYCDVLDAIQAGLTPAEQTVLTNYEKNRKSIEILEQEILELDASILEKLRKIPQTATS